MKTASFFFSAIFLSACLAFPEGTHWISCNQLTVPSTGHGEELTDQEFANHVNFWNFELVDEVTYHQANFETYKGLVITFKDTPR